MNMTITELDTNAMRDFTKGFEYASDRYRRVFSRCIPLEAIDAVLEDWSEPWNLPNASPRDWAPRKGETFEQAGIRWFIDHDTLICCQIRYEADYRAECHKEVIA